ncbi:hypothetical protein [Clostridium gasigenes]|uniref:Uncharacterized protein n=1 Tax=Clostridium gasigenes TaxID=94869 RepID=A0A1H0LBZ0_9CLOT|nr:hypothetical protein [Clostridium gasigenes]SDO65602.1 hypothetical protein SAMN04488529_10154 [Clostridium gasigenes]
MLKKIRSFQRVFFFQNNFDPTKSSKHVGKIFFMFIFFSIAYNIIVGGDANVIAIGIMPIGFVYQSVNKKIKLWELLPVSNKFAIYNIFFSFYHFIFIVVMIVSGFAVVSFIVMWLFSRGNSNLLLNNWNWFLADIKGFFICGGIISILFFFSIGNICIAICFIKDIKYRIGSLITIFVLFFVSAYVFKLIYNIKLSSALANIENINFKYILLGISSILFIISLFGGIKIALNLHKKIVINE